MRRKEKRKKIEYTRKRTIIQKVETRNEIKQTNQSAQKENKRVSPPKTPTKKRKRSKKTGMKRNINTVLITLIEFDFWEDQCEFFGGGDR